jgi:hypothetical protein
MTRALLTIVAFLIPSFFFSDLNSNSFLYARLFPAVVFISLAALAVWFAMLFHKRGVNQVSDSSVD